MGTTRETIAVTDQWDNWIEARNAAGEFTNDSEYIRDAAATEPAKLTLKRSALRSSKRRKVVNHGPLMVTCSNKK